jgi:hypothetical protein
MPPISTAGGGCTSPLAPATVCAESAAASARSELGACAAFWPAASETGALAPACGCTLEHAPHKSKSSAVRRQQQSMQRKHRPRIARSQPSAMRLSLT